MANSDHVAIVLKGSEFLNQWREENPDERLDLTNANLKGADLSRADLSGANLIDTKLGGATLIDAKLGSADLSDANLSYAKLIRAYLNDANLSYADLNGADLNDANLSYADLGDAYLYDADLSKANLSGVLTNLSDANLSYANLSGAELNDANLSRANLSGTNLSGAHLKGTLAEFSIVDGHTLLDSDSDRIDRDTDFSGVGLDGARVEEELKSALKRNIRQLFWEKRYRKNFFYNFLRPFWWASDYGSSTTRLIYTFLGISFVFSLIYIIPYMPFDWLSWNSYPFLEGLELDIKNYPEVEEFDHTQKFLLLWVRALYFSIVTMTTLGFGDMSAHPLSIPGHVLVCIQVILGYVLLGALITRLSILFQEVQ